MAAVVEVADDVEGEGVASSSASFCCPLGVGRPVSAVLGALAVVLAGGTRDIVTPLIVVVELGGAELVAGGSLTSALGVEALFGL